MEREAVDVINKITGTNIKYEEEEKVVNMCKSWDNSMKKAREAGVQEGRIAGIQEGLSCVKAVFKTYINGKSTSEISRELEMPIEEVEELLG